MSPGGSIRNGPSFRVINILNTAITVFNSSNVVGLIHWNNGRVDFCRKAQARQRMKTWLKDNGVLCDKYC
jgi:hypothetical protein